MIPTLWDIIFSDAKYPVTFQEKMKAGLREAGYILFFGVATMLFIIIFGVALILIIGTIRYWPPLLTLLTTLGFLHGFGVFRKRLPRRE